MPIYCFIYSAQGLGQMTFELLNQRVDLMQRFEFAQLCAAFAVTSSVATVLGCVLACCPELRCCQRSSNGGSPRAVRLV